MTQAYRIEGDFQMGRRRQNFSLECAADGPELAKDRIYTQLGSRHGVSRREVQIASVTAISGDDIRSAIIRRKLEQ